MAVTERMRDRTEDVRIRAQRVRVRAEHVQTRVERFLQIAWIAHIQRAIQRYNGRFGFQFGAGVAYFSVLAVVPVVMVAFSIVGFFIVELRPDLITTVSQLVVAQFRNADDDVVQQIEDFIVSTLQNYTAIGIVGLVTGLYSAAAWMGHLRNAIDAQWRTDFDAQRDLQFYPIKVAINLVRMAGLLVAIAVTFGLATVSTILRPERGDLARPRRHLADLGDAASAGAGAVAVRPAGSRSATSTSSSRVSGRAGGSS